VLIYYSSPKSQLGWFNLTHLDRITFDKDFKTLCSDYVVRSVRKGEAKEE